MRPDRPKAARPPAGRLARPLLTAGLVAALAVGLTFGATLAMSGRSNPPPGSGPVPAAAFGQLSSASLTAGTHSIVATYGGDATNNGSTSTALSQVVNSVAPPVALVNPSFEIPGLKGGYQYNPSAAGIGWTFSAQSGIQANNTFRNNGSGVAVMFTKRVQMTGNRFEDNWGAAAYGLLLKEISDSRLDRNVGSTLISYDPYPYSTSGAVPSVGVPRRHSSEIGTRTPSGAVAHSRWVSYCDGS